MTPQHGMTVFARAAMTAPPASTHHTQKKRNPRFKKPSKVGSPEAATPLPDDEGSDSGDEYHDALPGKGEPLCWFEPVCGGTGVGVLVAL